MRLHYNLHQAYMPTNIYGLFFQTIPDVYVPILFANVFFLVTRLSIACLASCPHWDYALYDVNTVFPRLKDCHGSDAVHAPVSSLGCVHGSYSPGV